MLRLIFRYLFAAIVLAAVIYELRFLARLLRPDVAPAWNRARSFWRKEP